MVIYYNNKLFSKEKTERNDFNFFECEEGDRIINLTNLLIVFID